MTIYSIFGWIGTVLIVGAYGLLSADIIGGGSMSYQLMNLFGAVGMLINVFHTKTWSAVALQLIWAGIAIWAIAKIVL